MDTFVVLQQMLILLAMMAIGYYSYRKEWIDRNAYGWEEAAGRTGKRFL